MLEFYPCVAQYEMFMISKRLDAVSSLSDLCPCSLPWKFINCPHSRICQGSSKIADERAREGSVRQCVGSEPTLGMDNQYIEMWQGNTSTQRQTRKLISDPSLTVKTKLLPFDRAQSGAVTGLFTGHNTLRRYLYLMGQINSPLRKRWGTREKTSAHVLFECEAMATPRHAYLGSFFFDPKDVRSLNLGANWKFSKGTGLPWLGHQTMWYRGPVKNS
jgi:hypothetical protein